MINAATQRCLQKEKKERARERERERERERSATFDQEATAWSSRGSRMADE